MLILWFPLSLLRMKLSCPSHHRGSCRPCAQFLNCGLQYFMLLVAVDFIICAFGVLINMFVPPLLRAKPSLTQMCIALLAADNTDELQSFAKFLLQMLPTKPDLLHMFIRSSLTKVEDALSGLKDAQSGWLRHCRSYSNACKARVKAAAQVKTGPPLSAHKLKIECLAAIFVS